MFRASDSGPVFHLLSENLSVFRHFRPKLDACAHPLSGFPQPLVPAHDHLAPARIGSA
jgi:hypothetical protein